MKAGRGSYACYKYRQKALEKAKIVLWPTARHRGTTTVSLDSSFFLSNDNIIRIVILVQTSQLKTYKLHKKPLPYLSQDV